MSRPAMASGSVAAWMGNGTVMPVLASTATSDGGTPRLAKVGLLTVMSSVDRADKRWSPWIGVAACRRRHIRGNQIAHRATSDRRPLMASPVPRVMRRASLPYARPATVRQRHDPPAAKIYGRYATFWRLTRTASDA